MKRKEFFKKLEFTEEQLRNYRASFLQDFEIASSSSIPQVVLRFSYDCIIKLAIYQCACQGYKVRSIPGHHIALLDELAEKLGEPDLAVIFDDFRQKRNRELYDGYNYATESESRSILSLVKSLLARLGYEPR